MNLRYRRGYPTRMTAPRRTGAGGFIGGVLILVLIASVAVLGFLYIRGSSYQSSSRTLFIETMQSECAGALALSRSMSLTAGASSYDALAKIRSSIHAMETVNEMYLSLEGPGHLLVSEDQFSHVYNVLDDYSSKLSTGMTTGDVSADLRTALTTLQQLTEALK